MRFFRLRCEYCGVEADQGVTLDRLRVEKGEFQPVICGSCGAMAASPTVRPWELTFNDRKLLRHLRITAE